MKAKMIDENGSRIMQEHFEKFAREVEELCQTVKYENEWLSSKKVCEILHITLRTLHYYRKQGMIPFSYFGNRCYFKALDIENLLSKSYIKVK